MPRIERAPQRSTFALLDQIVTVLGGTLADSGSSVMVISTRTFAACAGGCRWDSLAGGLFSTGACACWPIPTDDARAMAKTVVSVCFSISRSSLARQKRFDAD